MRQDSAEEVGVVNIPPPTWLSAFPLLLRRLRGRESCWNSTRTHRRIFTQGWENNLGLDLLIHIYIIVSWRRATAPFKIARRLLMGHLAVSVYWMYVEERESRENGSVCTPEGARSYIYFRSCVQAAFIQQFFPAIRTEWFALCGL